jgi:serine/threonine-protein kinase HipA
VVDSLTLIANRGVMGTLLRDKGRLTFAYDSAWRSDPRAFPLSLSMPLAAIEHKHAVVEAFLWGLLPDNERVIERWARAFQVSAQNPFGLLANVGEDCAGAVQFAVPEREPILLGAVPSRVDWLDDTEIEARLRTLREDHSAVRRPDDVGQFSLAGAQPKTAFFIDGDRIGVPSGRTPTTHIFKPPTAEYDGHAENEHFCLALARALGLAAARSEVRRFGEQVAIVVERFDRQRVRSRTIADSVRRIHQEDCCQALGKPPTLKYQSDGGPSPAEIAALLRTHSSAAEEDIRRFVDALLFNWLIGGTDAHAKNYALLLGADGQVRLAPLYDLGSALPYERLSQRRLKLAMKMGTSYRLFDVGRHHLRRLALAVDADPEALLERAQRMAESLPDAVAKVIEHVRGERLEHPVIDRLAARLIERAGSCARQLAA